MRIPFTNIHLGTLPSPLEAKYSETQPLIYLMYAGQQRGVWTQRNFAQYSDDGYKRNVISYKCVNELARGCAKITWRVKRGVDQDGKGGTDLPESHPLVKLLKKPNPFQSGASFRENVAAYLLLTGNSYIEGVGPDGKPPRELYAIRPDRTKVIPGEYGPAGYTYELNGRIKTWTIDPLDGSGPILHLKFFNPLHDWYGMSPLEAASYSIDGHNLAGEWNQSLLQNGCKPSGALVYKPGESSPPNLSEKQRASLTEQLNASQSGSRNAGRPMILEGGLEWQQISMGPVEMDYINGKNMSAREICIAYNVPPMILGIPGDNTYSNYQEARQALYQDTIIPLDASLIESLNTWLCPLFGDDIKIVQDLEHLPALSGVRKERWESVTNATWMTLNEKRAATGLEELPMEEADQIWMPSTLIPMTGAEPDGDETLGAVDEEGNPIPGADGQPLPPGGTTDGPLDAVQTTALNGTQISSLQAIVDAVGTEAITVEVAEAMIRISFPAVSEEALTGLMAALKKMPTKKPEPPPMPGMKPGLPGAKPTPGGKPAGPPKGAA